MDILLIGTPSARPYMNKERVRESLLGIEALAHTLQKFAKYGTDEFYTEVECGSNEPSDDEADIDRMDFIDLPLHQERVGIRIFSILRLSPICVSSPKHMSNFLIVS